MGDGIQQNTGGMSTNVTPRFRIVPGPVLGENVRSNANLRTSTLSTSVGDSP